MDYQFTPKQEELRREFAAFYREAMKDAPQGWQGGVEWPFISDENWAFHRKMAKKLAEKGWLTRTWPREYGGLDAPAMEFVMLNEVAGYHKAPGIDAFGLDMLKAALMAMGTEEQRRFYLPRMARGEMMWCQGWSEPDAGSDLSSLRTAAELKGDRYVVNGQKIWTSNAHRADWIFLLVRTAPGKQKGLTVLMVDMKTPGITVNPVVMMDGTHSFNEVFFDNVEVPVENRLGEENKGWQVTRVIMNQERMGMAMDIGLQTKQLEELVDFAKKTSCDGKPLIENALLRKQLAERSVEIEAARCFCYRLAYLVDRGADTVTTTPYASALKILNSETGMRMALTGCDIMGLDGQVAEGCEWAPLGGVYEHLCQSRVGLLLAGGSSGIQRNLIAWTGLQLPRT